MPWVIAIIVAVALSASHWKAYKQGEKATLAEWNEAKIETLKLARQRDEALRISKEKALEDQKKSIIVNVAHAERARAAADRLRNTSERSLAESKQSHAACLVSAFTHAELFAECRTEYRRMGQAAQGHTTDIEALIQAWPR